MFCDPATGEIIAEHPISEPGVKRADYVRHNRKP